MTPRNTLKKFALLVLAGSVGLLSCGRQDENQEAEETLRPVRTIVVEAPNLRRVRELTAVVDAARKADLSFKASGEIVKLLFKPGDKVKKGQVIARLDDTDYKIQLGEAQSLYGKAKADFDRAKQLIKSHTISRSDYDQLEAQLNSARAKLDSAKNNLAYTQLKASFDGVIAKRYIDNYQQLNAREPVVALHDLSNINLKVDVPESIMLQAKKEGAARSTVAIFDAVSDTEYPLELKEVSTQADEVTKTYEVIFTMKSPKNLILLPGMTARVRSESLITENTEANYFLPVNVVLKDSRGNYVFVVNPVGEGKGEVARKSVTIGEISRFGIQVFSGVEQGEHVITAGMSKVSEGMLVRFDGE